MSRSPMSLREKLGRAGIDVAGEDGAPALETPWFVRTLQALSGWLAAVFLLGFIALGAAFVIESSIASAALGFAMIAGAYGLLRMAPGDFVEHLALAASLSGQLLVAWALGSALGDLSAGLWWALLGVQAILALGMPSLTHRTFSAFAASLALYLALADSGVPYVAGGLVLLALTGIWLNEFRWPARLRPMQAWGYGLLLGLLAIQAVGSSGQSLFLGHYYPGSAPAWLKPWVGDALGTLALWLLLRHVFQRHAQAIVPSAHVAAYGAVAVLMLLSLQAHGLTQGAVVVALGFAIGHRLVMGLGVLSLLFSIAGYYYWLDATLLTKALTLFAIGALLLAIRWAMRHWWRVGQGDEARGSEGEGAGQ